MLKLDPKLELLIKEPLHIWLESTSRGLTGGPLYMPLDAELNNIVPKTKITVKPQPVQKRPADAMDGVHAHHLQLVKKTRI